MKKFILHIYRAVIPEAVRAVLIPPFIKKLIQQVFKSRLLNLIREAESQMQAEKWPEAIHCWQDLLNEYGTKAPAGIYIKLSRAHRKQGDLEAAATVAQHGHQHYPQEIKFVFELAEIAAERDYWSDAIQYWQFISYTSKENTPVGIFIKIVKSYQIQNKLKKG